MKTDLTSTCPWPETLLVSEVLCAYKGEQTCIHIAAATVVVIGLPRYPFSRVTLFLSRVIGPIHFVQIHTQYYIMVTVVHVILSTTTIVVVDCKLTFLSLTLRHRIIHLDFMRPYLNTLCTMITRFVY